MKGTIPRPVYLGRIIYLCFFPIVTVSMGNFALLMVPQAREALLAFHEARYSVSVICFIVSFLMWMISAWHVAHLLVGRRFDPDLVGRCRSAPFARKVTLRLPRLLAFAAGVPLAVYLTAQGESPWLGILLLALSIVVLVGIVLRRSIADRRNTEWLEAGVEQYPHFSQIDHSSRWIITAGFLVSLSLLVALPVGLDGIARAVGSPALLLFALMSWNIWGGFVFTYLPKAHGRPAMTWAPALAVVLFWPFNENHPVAPRPLSAAQARELSSSRAPLATQFRLWLSRRHDPQGPILFVAVAGGASRASYWSSAVLGQLADTLPAFSEDVFLISSISGGSVGAATFVNALEVKRRSHAPECARIREISKRFTGQDDLSTVLGLLLFPDLLQRFLPVPVAFADRSRGLEEIWIKDWSKAVESCGIAGPNPWAEPFLGPSPASGASRPDTDPLPLLALDSSALQAGRIVLQARFTSARNDVFDLFAPALATQSLTLAQAVHNSARFPYVSPAGTVRMTDGRVWDRLGDGGYVEASGALVLTQLLNELIQQGAIKDADELGHCDSSASGADAACFARLSQVRVLVIDNEPVTASGWFCVRPPYRDTPTAVTQNRIRPEGTMILPDLIAPMAGAFSTRGGRAESAEVDLLTFAGACKEPPVTPAYTNVRYAEIRYPIAPKGTEPSMNWMLNDESRSQMDQTLDHPSCVSPAHRLLQQNLEVVYGWFGAPAPVLPRSCP